MSQNKNPNQARTPGSTNSSKKGKPKGKAHWQITLEKRDQEIAELRKTLESIAEAHDKSQIEAAAARRSLAQKLGIAETGTEGLPDVAWGLLWGEYFRRRKEFQFVGPVALRSKVDRYGNKWSIESRKDLEGLEELAEAFGYDPKNPPGDDFIILHCHPDKGTYDIACIELEKAQKAHVDAEKRKITIEKNLQLARERNDQSTAASLGYDLAEAEELIKVSARKFTECKAIIEHAIQRFYLIGMDTFENMSEYGIPIKCQTVTLIPQKKHQDLPEIDAGLPV